MADTGTYISRYSGEEIDGFIDDYLRVRNYPNPNLLYNGDFKVNQRGQTSYLTNSYTADRWYNSDNSSVEVVENGLKTSKTTYGATLQKITEGLEKIINNPLTLTVELFEKSQNASPYCNIRVYDENGEQLQRYDLFFTANVGTVTTDLIDSRAHTISIILSTTGSGDGSLATTTWKNAKLEIGEVSTAFVSPQIADELARCQRYYQIRSTNNINALDLRPTMAKTPVITAHSLGGFAYDAET